MSTSSDTGTRKTAGGVPLSATLRTETGQRLHVPSCPYLGSDAQLATPAEQVSMSVCSWCQAEIDGVGRTYFDDLESALRFFGVHLGTRSAILDGLRHVQHDSIWVPHSKS